MTGAALECGGAREAPVKAVLGADVCGDVLVTCQAQLRLPAAVAAIVAVRAALFELRVCCGELAWHEQCLGIHGVSAPCCEQAEQYRECPYEPT